MLMSKCKDLKENNGLICILHVKYIRLHRLHFEIWSYRILFWMCHIWCIYTWFSIHVTCLPFDPKYNKYQNNKIPIWKVHEGLRDSGRRLVRPRLQKQIWKLSLKLGFSHWVSNLKIHYVQLQRCSEAEMKHDETKLMLATATCQNYWWTHLVDRNEHVQKLGFKRKAELVLRVQKFNHCV